MSNASSGTAIRGWDVFAFGSSRADVLSNLKSRWRWMDLDGDADDDVMTPSAARAIRVRPNAYFQGIDFRFEKGQLTSIRLRPAPARFPWLTLRKAAEEKYGPSDELTFESAVWNRAPGRLILDRDGEMRYLRMSTNRPAGRDEGAVSGDAWRAEILRSF